jgi:DNA polymerase bacteriophage-type
LIAGRDLDEYAVVFRDASAGQWRDCRGGAGFYGGAFTENAIQAISRDLLAEAMHRLEESGYPIILHCHDEVVCEMPDGKGSIEEFQKIMTVVPKWADGLPLSADVWEGGRYCK